MDKRLTFKKVGNAYEITKKISVEKETTLGKLEMRKGCCFMQYIDIDNIDHDDLDEINNFIDNLTKKRCRKKR